jgi:general secretion pathway protein K
LGGAGQRGAAVVMAMLVVAICAMMVTGVFQRQNIMARTLENSLAAGQVKWLMAGAVDWVRVILREDARASATDHLAEPWAVPLAQTRLSDDERDPAWLNGRVSDGQARINLRNLVGPEGPIESEVKVLERLLAIVGEDAKLAGEIARQVQARFSVPQTGGADNGILPATIEQFEFAEPKVREAITQLRPYITVLPEATPVNANTAPAEVLAARFTDLSLADARRLVASRDRAAFKDVADVTSRLGDRAISPVPGKLVVATRFFELEGSVEYRRARLHQRALLRRDTGRVDVVWQREVRP